MSDWHLYSLVISFASLYTLVLLSVDRFLYLKQPLNYSTLVTPKRMLFAIVVIWIVCIAISLPPLFSFGEINFSHAASTCGPSITGRTQVAPNFYYLLILVAVCLFCCLVLFIMYALVLCIARKSVLARFQHSVVNGADTEANTTDCRIAREKRHIQLRLVRVFAVIFTANLFTYSPILCLCLTAAVVSPPPALITIATLSYMSQTVINPILKACFIKEVRETMSSSLKCCRMGR